MITLPMNAPLRSVSPLNLELKSKTFLAFSGLVVEDSVLLVYEAAKNSSRTYRPLRMRGQYIPSKRQDHIMHWHSVVSHNNRSLLMSNITATAPIAILRD
jgi:hypothetical protein